jgi:hypothetical protein
MTFWFEGKTYNGKTASEIVKAIQRDKTNSQQSETLREFLELASLELSDLVPQRELGQSERLDEETLALNYLYLCDEYGVGKLQHR